MDLTEYFPTFLLELYYFYLVHVLSYDVALHTLLQFYIFNVFVLLIETCEPSWLAFLQVIYVNVDAEKLSSKLTDIYRLPSAPSYADTKLIIS